MKPQIVEKINNLVKKGVQEESDVFYILAQSRKYLESIYPERKDRENKYPTLSLFEDWILHSKLEGVGAQQKLAEYAIFFENNPKDAPYKFMTVGFTLFSDLKVDLMSFCDANNINTDFLIDGHKWYRFLELLVEILKDLPLEGKGSVKSFIFNDGFIVDDKTTVSFSIAFSDGRRGSYSIDLEILAINSKDKAKGSKID